MCFYFLKIIKTLFFLITLSFFSFSNILAFEKTISAVNANDKKLQQLKQELAKNKDDKEKNLQISLRKDRLFLQTLHHSLKKEQQLKKISHIKKTNQEIFTIYDKKILPNLENYDKKELNEITQTLAKSKQLLHEHLSNLKKIEEKEPSFLKENPKNSQIEKTLEATPLAQNAKKSFLLFSKRAKLEQEVTLKTLALSKQEIENFLNNSYHAYLNLLKRFQAKTKEILELKSRQVTQKQQISHKVELLQAYLKQNSLKQKILLKKSSIFYVTGDLKSLLLTKDTFIAEPKLPQDKNKKNAPINLKKIHFVGNSSKITTYSMPIVKAHAQKLKKLDNFSLQLHGHSDSKGEKEENYALSKKRGEEVKNALINFGIAKEKIKIFAHGDSAPIATNETKKGRLMNRRVEFKLIKGK